MASRRLKTFLIFCIVCITLISFASFFLSPSMDHRDDDGTDIVTLASSEKGRTRNPSSSSPLYKPREKHNSKIPSKKNKPKDTPVVAPSNPSSQEEGRHIKTPEIEEEKQQPLPADSPLLEEPQPTPEPEAPIESQPEPEPFPFDEQEIFKPSEAFVESLSIHPSDIPIALIAFNRPSYLERCLKSLEDTWFFSPDQITVFQHGDDPGVAEVVKRHGIRLVGHQQLHGRWEGAQHIADAYKFAFTSMFSSLFPNAENILVLEEDMIFSPDLLVYFAQVWPAISSDPSLYCVSAYNDNGFYGMHSNDPSRLHRSEFFIGLGWLVSRNLFMNEWQHSWPQNHWDHWLREPAQRRGRECLYPSIPRVYHIGIQGTHSNAAMYDQFFRNIHIYQPALPPPPSTEEGEGQEEQSYEPHSLFVPLADGTADKTGAMRNYFSASAYDSMMQSKYFNDDMIFVSHPRDILQYNHSTIGMVISGFDGQNSDPIWRKTATYFGIWPGLPIRGAHTGYVEFYWGDGHNHVFLIFTSSPMAAKRPHTVYEVNSAVFDEPRAWIAPPLPAPTSATLSLKQNQNVSIAPVGVSCTDHCANSDAVCVEEAFDSINQCSVLTKHFSCQKCEGSEGSDQPVMVSINAPANFQPGVCLANIATSGPNRSTCSGFHTQTQRLCVCAK